MEAKLTLTKPHDSWGEAGKRTHAHASELVAELRAGLVTFSIKDGGITGSEDSKYNRAETVSAVVFGMQHAKALAAFLASLPEEDA